MVTQEKSECLLPLGTVIRVIKLNIKFSDNVFFSEVDFYRNSVNRQKCPRPAAPCSSRAESKKTTREIQAEMGYTL